MQSRTYEDMFRFAEHNCGDCMLKCIDCDSQICPKCLVQCPVGNRCRKCTNRFTSHLLQVDTWSIVRALLGGSLAGLLFTGLQQFVPLGGFYMLFIVYLLGTFVGNLIFKIAKRKLGPKIAISVAVGLLLGSFTASFAWQNFYGLAVKQAIARTSSIRANKVAKEVQSNAGNGDHSVDSDSEEEVSDVMTNAAALTRAGLAPSPISLPLIIFALGALSPFLGWGNPLPNLFRR